MTYPRYLGIFFTSQQISSSVLRHLPLTVCNSLLPTVLCADCVLFASLLWAWESCQGTLRVPVRVAQPMYCYSFSNSCESLGRSTN